MGILRGHPTHTALGVSLKPFCYHSFWTKTKPKIKMQDSNLQNSPDSHCPTEVHLSIMLSRIKHDLEMVSPLLLIYIDWVLWFCLNLHQRTTQLLPHSLPLPSGMGRRIRRKKAKLVGWDENSLTEWQMEKKTTMNNTDKKYIQNAVLSPLMLSLLLSSKSLSFSQLHT